MAMAGAHISKNLSELLVHVLRNRCTSAACIFVCFVSRSWCNAHSLVTEAVLLCRISEEDFLRAIRMASATEVSATS